MVDYNSLNTRQKLNVLGLRIQREYTKRRHGDSIRIATSEEEAAQESGFMALPTTRLAPGKQLYMRMGEVKELPTGGFHTVKTAEQTIDPDFSVDLLDALEEEERKLYGENSIVARAANATTKATAPAVRDMVSELPEMPDLDGFSALATEAADELADMRSGALEYSMGRSVTPASRKRQPQSDIDFINRLMGK